MVKGSVGRPLVRTFGKQKVSLVDWFRRCYDGGEINQMVDPFIKDSISVGCMKSYSQLAMSCLLDDGNQRPSMSDDVGVLEFVMFAMQLVESEEDDKFDGTEEEGKNDQQRPLLLFPHFMSEEGSDMRFTTTGTDESQSESKSSRVTTISGNTE
ncbi:hypothetical protein RJT34_18398 [Clitoria ternatea]|uniref:Uncharacterized protein n=1 Tax=Clitoria ternatea TaxID=43366 RepID=A0AAN9JC06_CLITE